MSFKTQFPMHARVKETEQERKVLTSFLAWLREKEGTRFSEELLDQYFGIEESELEREKQKAEAARVVGNMAHDLAPRVLTFDPECTDCIEGYTAQSVFAICQCAGTDRTAEEADADIQNRKARILAEFGLEPDALERKEIR